MPAISPQVPVILVFDIRSLTGSADAASSPAGLADPAILMHSPDDIAMQSVFKTIYIDNEGIIF